MLLTTRSLAVLGLSVLLTTAAFGQTVALYTYSQNNGTYVPITAGTVLGTEANAAQKFVDPAVLAGGTTSTGVGFPIGFTFTFAGTSYDRLAISTASSSRA